ncbi:MAG TPA: carboxypeptidase-like regulatory domain-containing protein, partial [Chitinophagaceae bacterium]|nr:carboxypeptidase-like regulatory domain-containing protein [Chitinophagaceae bacterium]
MKRIIFLALYMLMLVTGKAQLSASNTIKGTVTDSISKLPLEYATITLYTKDSKKPLTGSITDKAGNFTIKEVKNGIYTIVFEFIGYKPFSLLLNKTNAVVDLKNISLSLQKNTLQAVTVVGQTKLVENKIDKLVFNAEKDLTSQSGVATDVL